MYSAYALLCVALNAAIPGVPLSLALCFSMLICGTNLIIVPLTYVVASVISLDWITVLLSVFESGFLTIITLIYRRTRNKIRAETAAYLAIALSPFVAFSRWQGIENIYITDNPYIIKAVTAIAVAAFCYFAFRSVYALIYRLCRCKLRADELLCLAILFTATGLGVYNLVGVYAYVCVGAGVIAFAVRLFKSPAAVIVACVVALPPTIAELSADYITAFTLISIAVLLFAGAGRFLPAIICLVCTALYLFLLGLYSRHAVEAVMYSLLLFVCCAVTMTPTEKFVTNARAMLSVKKVLPHADEDRLREYVSEKLYRTSEVFREIESAFNALDDGPDEQAMKERMLTEAKQQMCSNCTQSKNCEKTGVYRGFAALIEIGCIKGKVSFVDLSSDVTRTCKNPSGLTETVNRLLYEYRKSKLEAENAKNGRKLLADQAKGVAEMLKARAVEFCRESEDYSALEKKATDNLAANGISCPELSIYGDKNKRVALTLVGGYDPVAVKACLEQTTGLKLILKDKTVYDGQKCALLFVQPPPYDAAFGVAYAIKDGENVSGDTHSVIKINEHSFLMALSDGMGSGEYARKVSETAISLIEAFSRAEMPTEIVLETINKLLCFNRDERFTCIDAAAVNLNSLTASFIKIGSPVALIVRKGEIKVLESRSLPLGILDNVHPTTSREKLKKNDIIVFMSDGVTSAFNSVTDLYEFVETLKPLNPQALAEVILSAAKEQSCGTPDDMTVLCVRIYERQ